MATKRNELVLFCHLFACYLRMGASGTEELVRAYGPACVSSCAGEIHRPTRAALAPRLRAPSPCPNRAAAAGAEGRTRAGHAKACPRASWPRSAVACKCAAHVTCGMWRTPCGLRTGRFDRPDPRAVGTPPERGRRSRRGRPAATEPSSIGSGKVIDIIGAAVSEFSYRTCSCVLAL